MGMAARTKVLTYSHGQLAKPIPGTWWINGQGIPIIACPVCGAINILKDHYVGENGIIKGTVRCGIGCSWRSRIQLAGWSEHRRKSPDSGPKTRVDNR